MSNEELLKEIQVTVMTQTYRHLQNCAEMLHLSVGEVIDRAVSTISTDRPDIAATWTCDQFVFATAMQDTEQIHHSVYLLLALLVQSLLKEGSTMEDVVAGLQATIEELEDHMEGR